MGRKGFNTLMLVLFVWNSVLSISCANKSDPQESDHSLAIEEAQYWIDQSQPDRAIEILTPYLNSDTIDQAERVRLTLASAYVSRSGVDLAQLISVIKRSGEFANKMGTNFSEIESKVFQYLGANPELADSRETFLVLKQVYRTLLTVIETVELLDGFPTAQPEKQSDLQKAITLLSQSPFPLSTGSILYRGILRFIDFQMNLKYQKYFNSIQFCKVTPQTFYSELKTIEVDFVSLLEDFEQGLTKPQEQSRIRNFENQIKSELEKIYTQPLKEQELYEIQLSIKKLLSTDVEVLCL